MCVCMLGSEDRVEFFLLGKDMDFRNSEGEISVIRRSVEQNIRHGMLAMYNERKRHLYTDVFY